MPVRSTAEQNNAFLKALRAQVKTGADALQRGEFVEFDDSELERYLGRLIRRPRRRAR